MMNKLVSALLIGGLFGLGIAISGMANPAKVLNFFDLFGTWDPSLVFVMGGGLTVAAIGYRLLFAARRGPVLAEAFSLPAKKRIDAELELTIVIEPATSYEIGSSRAPQVAAGVNGPTWTVTTPPNVFREGADATRRDRFDRTCVTGRGARSGARIPDHARRTS